MLWHVADREPFRGWTSTARRSLPCINCLRRIGSGCAPRTLLERVNQEIKRRTRVIRIFPNEKACIRLVSALMMELNQEWMERVYLRMEGATAIAMESEARTAA